MTPEDMLILLARWLHILSASLAIGVPIYVRLVLMPALGTLEEGQRTTLVAALAKRWRILVYIAIVLFLATGFYNFLGRHARWRAWETDQKFQYHLLFGIKFFLALVMFFLASALAGRSAALAYFRKNAKSWTTVLVVLALLVMGISGVLRSL